MKKESIHLDEEFEKIKIEKKIISEVIGIIQ
jgi:hypothetical protein